MDPATDDTPIDLATTLAPEDIRTGAYVAIARLCVEYPSFLWCDGVPSLAADEPVRIEWLPPSGGMPLRVEAVCLPFVLVRSPDGERRLSTGAGCGSSNSRATTPSGLGSA